MQRGRKTNEVIECVAQTQPGGSDGCPRGCEEGWWGAVGESCPKTTTARDRVPGLEIFLSPMTERLIEFLFLFRASSIQTDWLDGWGRAGAGGGGLKCYKMENFLSAEVVRQFNTPRLHSSNRRIGERQTINQMDGWEPFPFFPV